MAHYGKHPRLSRETPPISDEVWHWFVCHGPHGEKFQWCDPVLGSGGELSLLRKFIEERSAALPDFETQARVIAADSLRDEDFRLVLKGIHVLTAIGTDEEMLLLKPLAEARNEEVAKHARTALFERRIKYKKAG